MINSVPVMTNLVGGQIPSCEENSVPSSCPVIDMVNTKGKGANAGLPLWLVSLAGDPSDQGNDRCDVSRLHRS